MPTYVFRCPKCSDTIEKYMSISAFDERDESHCGVSRETVIQACKGYVSKSPDYISVVTGNPITSWKKRREEFARENLMDVSDMPTDWKDDIGKLPECERPVLGRDGKPDPHVGLVGKKGTYKELMETPI